MVGTSPTMTGGAYFAAFTSLRNSVSQSSGGMARHSGIQLGHRE
jgi:hypothetical protein